MERRIKIIQILQEKNQVTMENLSNCLGVSVRTIKYDIDHLTLSYPIVTVRGRYGGGVKIIENYAQDKKYLNTSQIDLLEKLKNHLPSHEVEIINSILEEFALCR